MADYDSPTLQAKIDKLDGPEPLSPKLGPSALSELERPDRHVYTRATKMYVPPLKPS